MSPSLTPAAWTLIEGLLADYQRRMLLDLRRGGLTAEGQANYRRELAVAGEALVEIRNERRAA